MHGMSIIKIGFSRVKSYSSREHKPNPTGVGWGLGKERRVNHAGRLFYFCRQCACASYPCRHGECRCHRRTRDYSCACSPGFTGKQCEKPGEPDMCMTSSTKTPVTNADSNRVGLAKRSSITWLRTFEAFTLRPIPP